jgi:hypothetical protein
MQFAQIGGTAHRVFQALVGLVDAHRPLHGHALRCGALCRKFIGMRFALQFFPARIDGAALLRKAAREAKECEIVRLEVHK